MSRVDVDKVALVRLEPYRFRLNRNRALTLCFERDLIRKPVSTFRDHALARVAGPGWPQTAPESGVRRPPNRARMRAGVRGPRRSGPGMNGRARRPAGAALDHPAGGGGRQAVQRRGAQRRGARSVCAAEASDASSTAAARRGRAGRGVNPAAAACGVNARRTARSAGRERSARGRERQRGQERDDQPAGPAKTECSFAAIVVCLHGYPPAIAPTRNF